MLRAFTIRLHPLCIFAGVGLASCCSAPATRTGLQLTLGIHVNCPYGLAG